MKAIRRIICAVLTLAALLPALSGCGEQPEVVFRAALVGRVDTLDPALAVDPAEQTLVQHLYENLMKCQTDAEGTVTAAGAVARTWQCRDNLDGTETYTFSLRADARWMDGKAVTAEDFVYAWRRLVDPELNSPNASLLDMVAGYDAARNGDPAALAVTAVDGVTLEVALSCHCPYFLRTVCTAAATMPQRGDLAYKLESGTAGNGAYTVSGREDACLTLSASERYYDRRRLGPDRLELYVCADSASAASLLSEKKVQMVCGVDDPSVTDASWCVSPVPQVELLLINQMAQKLSGKELRRALSLAVDRTALSALAGEGRYVPTQGLIPYGVLTSDGAVFRTMEDAVLSQEQYEENCVTARQILADAGITQESVSGVTILYNAGGSESAVAAALRTMWLEQLGLEVKLRGVSAEEMERALRQGEYSIALWHQSGDRNDASVFLQRWVSGGADNTAQFHSSAYDTLLRAAAASSSAEARDAYLKDAEQLLLEHGNVIALYTPLRLWYADSGTAGLQSAGWGVWRFHGVTVTSV